VRQNEGRGLLRWYRGRRFAVFEVVRVTPQTLKVRQIKSVDVYFKSVNRRHLETEEVAGIFSYEGGVQSLAEQRVHIRGTDADALREYKQIDMEQAQKFEYHNCVNTPRTNIWNPRGQFGVSKIMHDAETGKLVVKYFPNESIP
jgi:hypothetical protein